jgi:hypothetical protein
MLKSSEQNNAGQQRLTITKLIENGLFHCTPLRNLKGILETGCIQPNQGQFPSEQPLSTKSACRRLGGISLFDLSLDKTGGFFCVWFDKTHLAIKLDRSKVELNLLNPMVKKIVVGRVLRGEVCCLAPIPVSCFAGYLLVSRHDRRRFSYLEARTDFKSIRAEARKLA